MFLQLVITLQNPSNTVRWEHWLGGTTALFNIASAFFQWLIFTMTVNPCKQVHYTLLAYVLRQLHEWVGLADKTKQTPNDFWNRDYVGKFKAFKKKKKKKKKEMLCLRSVITFKISIGADVECRKQQCVLQITDVLLAKEIWREWGVTGSYRWLNEKDRDFSFIIFRNETVSIHILYFTDTFI